VLKRKSRGEIIRVTENLSSISVWHLKSYRSIWQHDPFYCSWWRKRTDLLCGFQGKGIMLQSRFTSLWNATSCGQNQADETFCEFTINKRSRWS